MGRTSHIRAHQSLVPPTVKMALILHPSLRPHLRNISGVNAQFSDEVLAMITLNSSDGLTLQSSQLSQINAWSLDSLIEVQTGNVLVNGLVNTACNSTQYLLVLTSNSTSNSPGSDTMVLQDSSFSMAQQSALLIANYSSAHISATPTQHGWLSMPAEWARCT